MEWIGWGVCVFVTICGIFSALVVLNLSAFNGKVGWEIWPPLAVASASGYAAYAYAPFTIVVG